MKKIFFLLGITLILSGCGLNSSNTETKNEDNLITTVQNSSGEESSIIGQESGYQENNISGDIASTEKICGETLIYQYYGLINGGDFEKAFAMRYESDMSLLDFIKLYENTFSTSIEGLKEVDDNIYEISVIINAMDGLSKYKVRKEIIGDKIKSISTEKITFNNETPEGLINKYYNLINMKKFDEAFAMRYKSDSSLEQFKNTYKNIQDIGITQRAGAAGGTRREGDKKFKVPENTYVFLVMIRENDEETYYTVYKRIVEEKLEDISSEVNSVGCIIACESGDKPVIYLYPTKEQKVSVSLNIDGKLLTTYPEISKKNTWEVIAKPDGTLKNLTDKQEYSYLFRDAAMKLPEINQGFVIKNEDTIKFLQEKLSFLGLTPREYNEFIVYRRPRMKKNSYNAIYFAQKDYTSKAELTILPQPDSIQRVFMVFKGLESPIDLPEQKLEKFSRTGFSVIERGGGEKK